MYHVELSHKSLMKVKRQGMWLTPLKGGEKEKKYLRREKPEMRQRKVVIYIFFFSSVRTECIILSSGLFSLLECQVSVAKSYYFLLKNILFVVHEKCSSFTLQWFNQDIQIGVVDDLILKSGELEVGINLLLILHTNVIFVEVY